MFACCFSSQWLFAHLGKSLLRILGGRGRSHQSFPSPFYSPAFFPLQETQAQAFFLLVPQIFFFLVDQSSCDIYFLLRFFVVVSLIIAISLGILPIAVVSVGAALFLFQQLSGINAVVYYSTSVFRSAGIASDVAASALVGASNVLGMFSCLLTGLNVSMAILVQVIRTA